MDNCNDRDCNGFDIAIVGGGAYGAALAYESATRGLRTFLADKGDFGSGTSANSLKIVHGGLRYLQNLDLVRARSSALERSVLMRIAPSLVRPQKFVLPTGWKRGNGRLVMALGLGVNALVTAGRNRSMQASHRIGAGQILGREDVRRLVPSLKLSDITGGAAWHDGIMTDSERLCLAFVMSARDHGAVVRNYVRVDNLMRHDGIAQGLMTHDTITGKEAEISARVVVSCQGPWAQTDSKPLFGSLRGAGVTKAVNLVLPDAGLRCAVGFPVRDTDGRPTGNRLMFAVPWHGLTMIGTWYFESTERTDELSVNSEELDLMLREINSGFDGWRFAPADILATHIGQQPLDHKDPGRKTPINRPLIAEASAFGGLRCSWIVQGEKWTTARQTAQKALDEIAAREGLSISRSVSATLPLNTGLPASRASAATAEKGDDDADSMTDLQKEQVSYALQHEAVRTLPDLVLRRTNIGAGRRPNRQLLQEIAALAAAELGWSDKEKGLNVDAVNGHRMYSNAAIAAPN